MEVNQLLTDEKKAYQEQRKRRWNQISYPHHMNSIDGARKDMDKWERECKFTNDPTWVGLTDMNENVK